MRALRVVGMLVGCLVCGCGPLRPAQIGGAAPLAQTPPESSRKKPATSESTSDKVTPIEARSESPKPPISPAPPGGKFANFVNPPPPADAQIPQPLPPLGSASTAPFPMPPTPKAPLVAALECALDQRHEEALGHLKHYDAGTQEVFLRMLPTLALFARKKLADLSPAEVASLEEQLGSVRATLRQRAEFAIAKAAFCESIRGYAVYKPLPSDHEFQAPRAGRPGEMVQLYVELKNFASDAKASGFETRLGAHIEIVDERGERKWFHRFRPEDLTLMSRHRLAEYYHNFSFYLPATLGPGAYELRVAVADETSPSGPRRATATLPVRVAPVR